MLTKAHLIDSIIELNPAVKREWLAQFTIESIREYLERLRFGASPRGGASVWSRHGRRDDRLSATLRAA